jgi:hypothetical protein
VVSRLRNFFSELFEPWPTTHRKLAIEASATARDEGPSTLVVLVDAAYLPHGGRDRLTLRLREDGGQLERIRTPHRGDSTRTDRELKAEESGRVIRDLRTWDVWNLHDLREPVKDGLVCGFAFAEGDRVHSLQLHCGAGESKQLQLLRFLRDLSPMAEPAQFAYTTAVGKIGIRRDE